MPLRRKIIEYLYCKAVIIDDRYLRSALELGFDFKLFSMSYYETCKWKTLQIIFLLNLILLLFLLIPIVKIKKINMHINDDYNKALPNDILTYAQKAMAKTWMTQNISYIEKYLSDNVIYVVKNLKTIKGRDDYINYLKDKFVRDRTGGIKTHSRAVFCNFHKHSIVLTLTEDGGSFFQLLRIENDLITHIVLISTIEHTLYKLEKESLSIALDSKENQLPCMTCGILSENLQWRLFQPPKSWEHLHGRKIEITFCSKCKKRVEFWIVTKN